MDQFDKMLNEGRIKEYFKKKAKDFLDDDDKMRRLEKAGLVTRTVGDVGRTIAAAGAASAAVYGGYKFLKRKMDEKEEAEKLKQKQAEEARNESLEIYNLINEELDLVIFLDEDGDIFFMEEEIQDLLECYEIAEEDLFDILYNEDSGFELVDLSEGVFSRLKKTLGFGDRKQKMQQLEGMVSGLQKEVKDLNITISKNNDNIYNMSAKVKELERKCKRTTALAVGLGIGVPAAVVGIKALIKKWKEKKANNGDKKKDKKLEESALINELLNIDIDLYIENANCLEEINTDVIIQFCEDNIKLNDPYMEIIRLDKDLTVDVYINENGFFIDDEEMDLILEQYDDLTEDDIYELIAEELLAENKVLKTGAVLAATGAVLHGIKKLKDYNSKKKSEKQVKSLEKANGGFSYEDKYGKNGEKYKD